MGQFVSDYLEYPLVTGAGGFIGSNLVSTLVDRETTKKVYALDRPGNKELLRFENNPKVEIHHIDLTTDKFPLSLNPSCIFMLAALNGTSKFYSHPWEVLINSTLPTLNTIKAFQAACPILYSSSSEVYASTINQYPHMIPTKENVNLSIEDIHNPRWSYAAAKIVGEIAMQAAAIQFGSRGVIVRYHNVYGPRMGDNHFVPEFMKKCMSGNFDLIGATETRAFMYIQDAINGTISAIQKASNQIPIYHLGSEEELTILSAAQVIVEELKLGSNNFNMLPSRLGSVNRRIADISKAKNELGWYPEVSFREGIKKILASQGI